MMKKIILLLFRFICSLSNDQSKKYLVAIDNANQEINRIQNETHDTLNELVGLMETSTNATKKLIKEKIDMLTTKKNCIQIFVEFVEDLQIDLKNIEKKIQKLSFKKEFNITEEDELLINNTIAIQFNQMNNLISQLNQFIELVKNLDIKEKQLLNYEQNSTIVNASQRENLILIINTLRRSINEIIDANIVH